MAKIDSIISSKLQFVILKYDLSIYEYIKSIIINKMKNHYISPIYYLILLGLIVTANSWTKQAEDDRVSQLDGYLNFTGKFQMFSGYLTLNEEPLINVHYLFVTSTKASAQTDDVVLWLNGGPGCSSLLGFSQEIGPNMLYSGSKKFADYFNPFSWNQQANLLFFESPPGVGFSVNNDTKYVYNESRTASDNVLAVQAWFKKYPQFQKNNFWISGESYCGMYIPYFASALIDANKAGDLANGQTINFKGIMIGNGVMRTDRYWRREARNKFYSKHYFYGNQINKLISNCDYNQSDQTNPSCIKGNIVADQSVQLVNPYATIGICYTPDQTSIPSSLKQKKRRRFYYAPFFEQNNDRISVQESLKSGSSPCTDDFGITAYFNLESVKKQLNVDASIQWQSCTDFIGQNYHKSPSSIQIFNKLKQNKLKILLYSGNTDAIVSYVQTQKYVQDIGWKKIAQKQAFQNDRSSLLGWITQYDGLTLVIINGAGHMVPSDKPNAAYIMFRDFISRKSQ